MEKKINLIIFHYHFLRGGVRSAILGSLKALRVTGHLANYSLIFLCGRKNGVDSFVNSMETPEISVHIDPRLDYSDKKWPDENSFRKESFELASYLLKVGGNNPSIYWLHNPTLGKNPLVTAAWYEAARLAVERGLPYGFLYHIHDFAECGRIENLLRLKTCWKGGGLNNFYPVYPNVCYGLLNSADKFRTLRAGLAGNRVFWLPNVVFTQQQKDKGTENLPASTIISSIAHYAEINKYTFFSNAGNWVMPIRLIRRKNVLEGILLALMHSEPKNVLITLDATSAQEMEYANSIKEIVRELKFPAVIGFGDYLVGRVFSFDDLLYACEAVVTTSFLEGFGFAFLEGLLNGIPITGRNISFITDDFVPLGFPVHALYDEFLVPLDIRTRSKFIKSGEVLLNAIDKLVYLSPKAKERFIFRLKEVYGSELVDFAALDLKRQVEVCRKLKDVCLLNEISIINDLPKPPAKADNDFFSKVDSVLGPEAHSIRLLEAFSSVLSPVVESNSMNGEESNISSRIMEQFLDPLYLRPLLGGWV